MVIIPIQHKKCVFLIALMAGSLMILTGHVLRYVLPILHYMLTYPLEHVYPLAEKIWINLLMMVIELVSFNAHPLLKQISILVDVSIIACLCLQPIFTSMVLLGNVYSNAPLVCLQIIVQEAVLIVVLYLLITSQTGYHIHVFHYVLGLQLQNIMLMYLLDHVWIPAPIWLQEIKLIGIQSWGYAYLFALDCSSLIILLEIVCRFVQQPLITLDRCPQNVVCSAAMLLRILGLRISQDFALQSALLDLFLIILLKDVLLYAQSHSYTMAILQPINV